MHANMRFFRASLLFMSMFVSGAAAVAQLPKGTLTDAPVANKTKNIKVMGLYKVAPENPRTAYKLLMRNDSNKAIAAYCIRLNEHTLVGTESDADNIGPGTEFSSQLDSGNKVSVEYVVFEDGTTEGDSEAATEFIERRAGELEQRERIDKILTQALASGDVEWLISALRQLPDEPMEGRSIHFQLGLRFAKENAILAAKRLENKDLLAELKILKTENERTSARLRRLVRH